MADKNVNINITVNSSEADKKVKNLGKSVGGLKNPASGLKGVFKSLGNSIAGAFSAKAIVGFHKEALNLRASFEQSMANVQALSGATGAQLEALTNKAREMGKNTVWTAKDAADGMGHMAQLGWETKDMLDGIEPVLNLATAANTDLAKSSDIVAKTMKTYGMESKRATEAADIFAKIQAKTGTNFEQMGEAMRYVGPVASSLGMDLSTTSKYIGILGDNAITGSMAGTTLRSMFSRLAYPVKEVQKGFDAYNQATGITINKTDSVEQKIKKLASGWSKLSENQKIQVANQVAGKQAMSGFLNIMKDYEGGMKKLDAIMKDNNITAKSMADIQKTNLAGAFHMVRSAWEEFQLALTKGQSKPLQAFLGEIIKVLNGLANELEYVSNSMELAYNEIIKPALEGVNKLLNDLGVHFGPIKEFMSNTLGQSKEFQKVIGMLGFVFAGLIFIVLPALGLFGGLKLMFGWIVPLVGGLISGLGSLGLAFIGIIGSITWPIALMGLLIGTGIALMLNWDEICTWASEVWGKIDHAIQQKLTDIEQAIGVWEANTGEYIKQHARDVKSGIVDTWEDAKSALANKWDNIATAWGDWKDLMKSKIEDIKEAFRNMFNVNIKLPHIPMPQISSSGSFSLNPPSVPHFEWGGWHAKGAIFTKPTAVNGMGVGDASNGHGSNAEAVLPIDELPNLLGLDRIHATLDGLQNSTTTVNLNVDGRTLAQTTYNSFDRVGGQKVALAGRGIR